MKIGVNPKDGDLKKKDGMGAVAPDSTKSGNKALGKPEDGEEGEGGNEPQQPQEPKQYRYFPPRRLPNPFESAA